MKQSDLNPDTLSSIKLHIRPNSIDTDQYAWAPQSIQLRSATCPVFYSHSHMNVYSSILELNAILNYAREDPEHPFNCLVGTRDRDGSGEEDKLRNPVYAILKYYERHPRRVAIMSKKSRSGISTKVTNYVDIAETVNALLPKINRLLEQINCLRETNRVPSSSCSYNIPPHRRPTFDSDGIQYLTSFKLYRILKDVEGQGDDYTFRDILRSVSLFQNIIPDDQKFSQPFFNELGALHGTPSTSDYIDDDVYVFSLYNLLRYFTSNLCIGTSSILHIIVSLFIESLLLNTKKNINTRITVNRDNVTSKFVDYNLLGNARTNPRFIDLIGFLFEYILYTDNSTDTAIDNLHTLKVNLLREITKYMDDISIRDHQIKAICQQIDTFISAFKTLRSISECLYDVFLKDSKLENLLSICEDETSLDKLVYISAPLIAGKYEAISPQFMQKINYAFSTHTGLTALNTQYIPVDRVGTTTGLFVSSSITSTTVDNLIPVFEPKLSSSQYYGSITATYYPRDEEFTYWLLTNYNFPTVSRKADIVDRSERNPSTNYTLGDIVFKSNIFSINNLVEKDNMNGSEVTVSPFDYRFLAANVFWNSYPGKRNFPKLVMNRASLKYKTLSVLYSYLFIIDTCFGAVAYGCWGRATQPKFNCFSIHVEDGK